MAENTPEEPQAESQQDALEQGKYESIRQRLDQKSKDLRQGIKEVDEQRAVVFGSRKLQLKQPSPVTTQLNCEARDVIQLGAANRFLFGFNVHLGLKRGELGDVFAVYDYDPEEEKFRESEISFLQDEEFVKNFTQLYKITV